MATKIVNILLLPLDILGTLLRKILPLDEYVDIKDRRETAALVLCIMAMMAVAIIAMYGLFTNRTIETSLEKDVRYTIKCIEDFGTEKEFECRRAYNTLNVDLETAEVYK